MTKVTNVFSRTYESEENEYTGPDGRHTVYDHSIKDNIQKEIEERCISIGPHRDLDGNYFHFQWYENRVLTFIEVEKPEHVIGEPSYEVEIKLQTMGSDSHPQGLLALLETHEFQKQSISSE